MIKGEGGNDKTTVKYQQNTDNLNITKKIKKLIKNTLKYRPTIRHKLRHLCSLT